MNAISLSRSPAAATPDLAAVKAKQQGTWGAGDYARIGVRLQVVGETLCEAADIRANEHVLDVAAGNGNASLAAARRFAHVTSTDYVPALLESGRRRAEADGLEIDFRVADAEKLPFESESFDVVLSTYGVMFTPDQEAAAGEMLRVLRPGGRIALANWTPEGFIGQLFKVVGRHVPPPAGVKPASLWGTETRLVELFGPLAADIRATRRHYLFTYPSPDHWIDYFRTWYGPVLRAFGALDEEGRKSLRADILELIRRFDWGDRGSMAVPGEYLEVVIVKGGRAG